LWYRLHLNLVAQILVAADAIVVFLDKYSRIAQLSPACAPLVADDPKRFLRRDAPAYDVYDVVENLGTRRVVYDSTCVAYKNGRAPVNKSDDWVFVGGCSPCRCLIPRNCCKTFRHGILSRCLQITRRILHSFVRVVGRFYELNLI